MTGCVEATQLLAGLLPGHPRHRVHHVLAVGAGDAGAGLAAHRAVAGPAHGVAVGSVRLLRVRAGEQQAPILRGRICHYLTLSSPLFHLSIQIYDIFTGNSDLLLSVQVHARQFSSFYDSIGIKEIASNVANLEDCSLPGTSPGTPGKPSQDREDPSGFQYWTTTYSPTKIC